MYKQTDGVAMGSPLGVLFANLFMGTIEADKLRDNRSSIYCGYIDDIFVRVRNKEELQALKEKLATASGLNFTYEKSRNGRLPFWTYTCHSPQRWIRHQRVRQKH